MRTFLKRIKYKECFEMEIHKGFIDLAGYAINVNGLSIIPVRIDANDEYCEVEFNTVNKLSFEKTFIRKGKHQNFIFNTSIHNIKIAVNLQTGVIRKIREH